MIKTTPKIKINPKLNPLAGENTRAMETLTSPLLTKMWRLRLIANRLTSLMTKSKQLSAPGPNPNPIYKSTDTTEKLDKEFRQMNILNQVKISSSSGDRETNGGVAWGEKAPRTTRSINNRIVIINPNVSPALQIELQNRPFEMEVKPESTWTWAKFSF